MRRLKNIISQVDETIKQKIVDRLSTPDWELLFDEFTMRDERDLDGFLKELGHMGIGGAGLGPEGREIVIYNVTDDIVKNVRELLDSWQIAPISERFI